MQYYPAFGQLSDKWKMGIQSESFFISGNTNISLFQNFLLLEYNYKKSERLDFFLTIGLGAVYASYVREHRSYSGLDPSAMIRIGWQGVKFGNFRLRPAIRYTRIQESKFSLDQFGTEIGLTYEY